MNNSRIDPEDLKIDFRTIQEIMETHVPKPKWNGLFTPGLKPGCYILYDILKEEMLPKAESLDIDANDIVVVRDNTVIEVREAVQAFLESADDFHDNGYIHKGGLGLEGPPGSGKTTLLRQVVEDCVERGHIVFYSQSPYVLSRSLANFRNMSDAPVICVIEDIDTLCRQGGEHDLLEMIDGMKSVDGTYFLATINDRKNVPPRLFRKGRFDKRVMVPYPDLAQRVEYLTAKAGDKLDGRSIRKVCLATEGLGFASLDAVVKQVLIYKTPLAEAIAEAKDEERLDGNGYKGGYPSCYDEDSCE